MQRLEDGIKEIQRLAGTQSVAARGINPLTPMPAGRLTRTEMLAYLKWARSIRWSHLYGFMRFVS